MNILYISNLNTNIAAGPNWSVPARVAAQSEYDNVMLLNTTNVMMEHWKDVKVFHNLSEFGELHLRNLPNPFSRPDIVVFEGFNFMEHVKFARELRIQEIPYIITPRGAMTYEAQHNHAWMKKAVARWLFQNSYIKHAVAIQYLTDGESKSSHRMFKTHSFVLPNGFNEVIGKKQLFSDNGIKAVFIGRLDMYHKGIDLLLNAVESIKDELIEAGFSLEIYGPRRYDYYKIGAAIETQGITNLVKLCDEVGGDDKRQVLLNADLFVMTSRLEGLPMGLLEALAYGVPCFVSIGTNMREDIDEYGAGWTCDGTEDDIKRGLKKIIAERNKLTDKSLNALKLSEKYQWNKIALSFHEQVETLIGNFK